MKRVGAVLLLYIMATTTQAGPWSRGTILSLSGGMALPVAPSAFSDFYNPGFNLGVGFGYAFTPVFSFLGQVDYNQFSFDSEAFVNSEGAGGQGLSISGGSTTAWSVTAGVKAAVPPEGIPLSPYVVAGWGVFHRSTEDATVTQGGSSVVNEGDSEFAFALVGGGGVSFTISNTVDLFLQVMYSVGFTKGDHVAYVPTSAGILLRL